MIIYDTFFRRYGVRFPQHLLAPNLPSLENFSFPKNSIHHFTTMDNIVVGPSTHEYLYRDIEKKIFVYHVLESTASKGDPRKVAIPLEPLVREFHIRHKRYRRAIKLENIPRDENTLAVINYALLTKSSRYMKSLYAEYNRYPSMPPSSCSPLSAPPMRVPWPPASTRPVMSVGEIIVEGTP